MTTAMTTTSEETAVAVASSRPHEVIALDAPQLEKAHAQMLDWVATSRASVFLELDEERKNLETATKQKWATDPFRRRIARLDKRVQFFDKIEAGLRAGFVLVPNFPMDIFAIRTAAKGPRHETRDGKWNRFVQPAQLLAAGAGRYVDPAPHVITDENRVGEGDKARTVVTQWPAEEFDDVSFPLAMARPSLMTRAGEAMALKIFDEVGIARDSSGPRPDPILIGRILNPNRGRPAVSFFLGWSFDPSRL